MESALSFFYWVTRGIKVLKNSNEQKGVKEKGDRV